MNPEFFLENKHIESIQRLTTPAQLHQEVQASTQALKTVAAGRRQLEAILCGHDSRPFVVVGPCSIHDPQAALDYAERLSELSKAVAPELLVVMRVYFEKPRTTVGWKGLINDPDMDDSFDVEKGLRLARQLLISVNEMGLPVGTEALDPLNPQYLGDLVSWSAIGARTTESQTHREMASGLSTPVGFKNGTDGNLKVALNAMLSAQRPHAFLGVDAEGHVALVRTGGNSFGHLILRGGATPNYSAGHVQEARAELEKAKLPVRIVIDCSHGNSNKDHRRQAEVFKDVLGQRAYGDTAIKGVMLESNLVEGQQALCGDRSQLTYGQSVTDACLGWDATRALLLEAAETLARRPR